jgi:phosphate:Na+ symporter
LVLVAVGLAMTAVMQSSTAAIAVTLSAFYAGAVGLDQACALVIGQNIGTATSSAMAAIGASSTAKRLALAYTAYNVVGVLVLLPLIDKFTRFVERLLPERRSPLTRCLDPAALSTPIAAVEAVRRTVARAFAAVCQTIDATLTTADRGGAVSPAKGVSSVAEAADALRQAREFMSRVDGPPESEDEQRRLTSALHALDHASRLTEAVGGMAEFGPVQSNHSKLDESGPRT